MTGKHDTPQWRRTRRIIRAQAAQTWARGDDVTCWRHGHVIPEGDAEQPGGRYAYLDVGHLTPDGGEGLDNAAPECRTGNRSHGGKRGARITNTRNQAKTTGPTKGLVTPPWA